MQRRRGHSTIVVAGLYVFAVTALVAGSVEAAGARNWTALWVALGAGLVSLGGGLWPSLPAVAAALYLRQPALTAAFGLVIAAELVRRTSFAWPATAMRGRPLATTRQLTRHPRLLAIIDRSTRLEAAVLLVGLALLAPVLAVFRLWYRLTQPPAAGRRSGVRRPERLSAELPMIAGVSPRAFGLRQRRKHHAVVTLLSGGSDGIAADLLAEVVRTHRATPHAKAAALAQLALVELDRGDLEHARTTALRATASLPARGPRHVAGLVTAVSGVVRLASGDATAVTDFRTALPLLRRRADRTMCQIAVAWALARAGRTDEAEEIADAAWTMVDGFTELRALTELEVELTAARLAAGDVVQARERAERLAAKADPRQDVLRARTTARAELVHARVLLQVGETVRAQQLLAAAAARLDPAVDAALAGAVRILSGKCLAESGRWREAVDTVAAGLAVWERRGCGVRPAGGPVDGRDGEPYDWALATLAGAESHGVTDAGQVALTALESLRRRRIAESMRHMYTLRHDSIPPEAHDVMAAIARSERRQPAGTGRLWAALEPSEPTTGDAPEQLRRVLAYRTSPAFERAYLPALADQIAHPDPGGHTLCYETFHVDEGSWRGYRIWTPPAAQPHVAALHVTDAALVALLRSFSPDMGPEGVAVAPTQPDAVWAALSDVLLPTALRAELMGAPDGAPRLVIVTGVQLTFVPWDALPLQDTDDPQTLGQRATLRRRAALSNGSWPPSPPSDVTALPDPGAQVGAGPSRPTPGETIRRKTGPALKETLFGWLEAQSTQEQRAYLRRHPELLDPSVDPIIARLILTARLTHHEAEAHKLAAWRALLGNCRQHGVDDTFDRVEAPRWSGSPEFDRLRAARRRRLDETGRRDQVTGLRRELARTPRSLHPGHWATLTCMLGLSLSDLADALGHHHTEFNEHCDEAIRCFEAALEVFTRDALPIPWSVTMLDLGRTLDQRGGATDPWDEGRPADVERAIQVLHEALEAASDPPAWAFTHGALGEAYFYRVQGDRAASLERVIDCCTKALQLVDPDQLPAWADPPDWARIHRTLGQTYAQRVYGNRAHNAELAISHLRAAMDLLPGDRFPNERADVAARLGVTIQERVFGVPADNAAQAVRLLTEAASGQALPGMRGVILHELGNAHLHHRQHDPAGSTNLAITSLEEATSLLDPASAAWAGAQHSLGNAYQERLTGDRAYNIERAMEAFRAAVGVFERLGSPHRHGLALYSLGGAAHARIHGLRPDNIRFAIDCLEAAKDLLDHAAAGPHERSIIRDGLGVAYAELTEPDLATNLEQAIAWHREAREVIGDRETDPAAWATVHNNLGAAILARRGPDRSHNLREAIACLEEARTVGPFRNLTSAPWYETLHNLGVAYAELAERGEVGQRQSAVDCFAQALAYASAAGLPRLSLRAARALGDAYASAQDWSAAAAAYRTALAAGKQLYEDSVLREAKRAELYELSDLHSRAAYAIARTGDLADAVVVLERGRARALGSTLVRDMVTAKSGSGQAWAQYTHAAERVRELEDREWVGSSLSLAPLVIPTSSEQSVHTLRLADLTLRQLLTDARRELARAREPITEEIRLAGHTSFLRQPELADITSVAATMGPIAYLAATQLGCLTLLVAADRDGGPPMVRRLQAPDLPFTAEALRAMLIRADDARPHRGYLREQVEHGSAGLVSALDELLPILGRELMHPLAEAVQECGGRGVTIVACGLLGLLPLHAAGYTRNGSPRTLLDELEVGYAPSARVLDAARSRRDRRTTSAGRVLVGVGNPAGSSPLPNAAFETREIARLFDREHTFYEAKATKTALVKAASGATHVHLACHGTFEANDPLESALSLAGDDRTARLTLREILTDRPFRKARLVVASACRTAVTDFLHLPDEVMGLPSGLLQAGAPGIIGTLWPVDDLSTALLMIRFYEELIDTQGPEADRPAAALRSAQRWLARSTIAELDAFIALHDQGLGSGDPVRDLVPAIAHPGAIPRRYRRSADERPFAHPYFWAPFVFVGA